jgi:acetyltransferase-like isoleucine patch superfamily enzyme
VWGSLAAFDGPRTPARNRPYKSGPRSSYHRRVAIFHRAKDGNIERCAKRFFLYGNGPHTRVIYGYLYELPGFAGFVVDDVCVPQTPRIDQYDVVPFSRVREVYPPSEYDVLVPIGFRDFNALRERKSEELKALGYALLSFVDDSVRLPRHYDIAPNCIVIDHASLNDGVAIHEGVFVSSGAMVGHDSQLRRYSWIGSGVAMAGCIDVGEYTILGLNCAVKQNLKLGHHTLVLPSTFVNAHTKPYEAVAAPAGKSLKLDSRRVMKFAYIDTLSGED